MTDREFTETQPVSQSLSAHFPPLLLANFVHKLSVFGSEMWINFRVLHGAENCFHRA